jgi:hypothetical protein
MGNWILIIFLMGNGSAIERITFPDRASCVTAQKQIQSIGQEAIKTVCLKSY